MPAASQALDHRWLRLPLREVSSVPLPSAKSRLQETVNRMRLPVRHFEPGEFLLRAGEANNELYLLREGKAEVLAADIDPMLPEGAYDSSDDDMDGGGAGGAGDWNNSNGNGRSGWGSPFGSPERPGTRSHGAGAGAGGALSGGASGGGGYPSNGNGGYGASNNNVMGLDLGGGGRSNTFGSGARGGTFSGESVGSPRGSVGSPRSVFSDSRMVAVSTVGEGDFVGEPGAWFRPRYSSGFPSLRTCSCVSAGSLVCPVSVCLACASKKPLFADRWPGSVARLKA